MPSVSRELSLPMANSIISMDNLQCRKELDAICRRNQSFPPSTLRSAKTLAPVPEMSTPGSGPIEHSFTDLFNKEDNPMTYSRLFQEFSNRRTMPVYNNIQQQNLPSKYFISKLCKII